MTICTANPAAFDFRLESGKTRFVVNEQRDRVSAATLWVDVVELKDKDIGFTAVNTRMFAEMGIDKRLIASTDVSFRTLLGGRVAAITTS